MTMSSGAGSQIIYTCPAGKVALVKSIRLTNTQSIPLFVLLGIGGIAISQRVLQTLVPADGQYIDADNDPIVLAAGEYISGQSAAGASNTCAITLSGAELDA